jgi:hypothetical protein
MRGNRRAENVSQLRGPVEQGLERVVVPVLVKLGCTCLSEGSMLGGAPENPKEVKA